MNENSGLLLYALLRRTLFLPQPFLLSRCVFLWFTTPTQNHLLFACRSCCLFAFLYFYGVIFGVDGIVACTTLSTLQFVLLACRLAFNSLSTSSLAFSLHRCIANDMPHPVVSIHIHVYAHVFVMIHYHLTILIYTIYTIPHSTLLSFHSDHTVSRRAHACGHFQSGHAPCTMHHASIAPYQQDRCSAFFWVAEIVYCAYGVEPCISRKDHLPCLGLAIKPHNLHTSGQSQSCNYRTISIPCH